MAIPALTLAPPSPTRRINIAISANKAPTPSNPRVSSSWSMAPNDFTDCANSNIANEYTPRATAPLITLAVDTPLINLLNMIIVAVKA